MRIGAHVSSAGGVDRALDRAQQLGAETVQLFCSSPQSWAFKPLPENKIEAFRRKTEDTGIRPAFLHGIYLINLGTSRPEHLEKSVDALVNYMGAAAQLGCAGVIFHAGSHGGAGYDAVFRQTVDSLVRVLDSSPGEPWLILENSAGMGYHIGSSFEEIGGILQAVGSPRVKVCIDTQHAFAAGYNLAGRDDLERAVEQLNSAIGVENLVAVHANDSKVALGAGVDRHENIGEGYMGEQAFGLLMSHPVFSGAPFLLEVPGADGKGPDKVNIDRLRDLRERAASRA